MSAKWILGLATFTLLTYAAAAYFRKRNEEFRKTQEERAKNAQSVAVPDENGEILLKRLQ